MIQRHVQFTDIFTYAIVEDWSLFTVLLFSPRATSIIITIPLQADTRCSVVCVYRCMAVQMRECASTSYMAERARERVLTAPVRTKRGGGLIVTGHPLSVHCVSLE